MNRLKRLLPLLMIFFLMAVAYWLDLRQWLSLEALKTHREALALFVEKNPIRAPLAYMVFYFVVVALSIPGAVFLTLAGGFLFPQPWSTLYTVCGASCGAIAIFLAARMALGDFLKRKVGPFLKKMKAGIQEDGANYLLFLRLVPIFPFWAVNLAPAFFGVSIFTFFWTTFVGIIPGSFVFTQLGTGLNAILESDTTFSINSLLNREMKIAFIALGCFALLPVLLKYKRQKK